MKKAIPHILAGLITISSVPVIFSGITSILDCIPERKKEVRFDDFDDEDDE